MCWKRRNRVGRIIEWCLVSADGIVLDDPLPPGFRDYQDEAYLRDALGIFEACDAMLWGRPTYERFAKMYPGSEGTRPYAARLSAVPKYVFSSKLQTAEWSNSTLIRGDVAVEVTRLKQHDGGDLLLLGHGLLGETLLKQRLLDVILSIYPLLLGHGKPIVREGQAVRLKLAVVDQGGNRRSQAFLARTFSIKTRENYFVRKEEQKRKKRRPCGN
jgi:dihydrofolate reductase